jgi:DNA-binding Lrp family transcriptional regulator
LSLKTRMDEKDLILLQVLAEDGRANHVALGKTVDLSEGAVRGRLDWLQANEILLGFKAVIKPGVLDPHLLQLVEFVILSGPNPETVKRFEAALTALPGIASVDVLDRSSYQVRIAHGSSGALLQAVATGAGVQISISRVRTIERVLHRRKATAPPATVPHAIQTPPSVSG